MQKKKRMIKQAHQQKQTKANTKKQANKYKYKTTTGHIILHSCYLSYAQPQDNETPKQISTNRKHFDGYRPIDEGNQNHHSCFVSHIHTHTHT